ncbi:hypothetical protein AB0I35_15210 [Nocardia sp. NPDC050378]|uniref:hypothetical protein n=1 Tax=Nocardia sp. NPDC050378 TaxID=3155400 RepID=UPI0033ED1EA5
MSDLLDLVNVHYAGLEGGDLEMAASPFTEDVAAQFPSGPLTDTFTLRDGKVPEHRVYWDNVSFLTQLGLMPAQD